MSKLYLENDHGIMEVMGCEEDVHLAVYPECDITLEKDDVLQLAQYLLNWLSTQGESNE